MVATKMPHQLRRDDVVRFKFGLRQVQGKVTGVLRSSTTTRDSLYRVEFSVGEAQQMTAMFPAKELMFIRHGSHAA